MQNIITPDFSVTCSFRNHSHMKKHSSYYLCLKSCAATYFCGKCQIFLFYEEKVI